MTSEYKHTFNLHPTVKAVRWWRVVSCLALVMVLCTALATAGVVKSKGVKRIVDGPHGEVVVDSVLDTTGIPLVQESPKEFEHSSAPEPATSPKQEKVADSNNQVQYQEPVIDPEDYEKKDNNGILKIIVIGVLILALGGGTVIYINKRN